MRRGLLALAAAAALAGCGAPEQLSEEEGRALQSARERLDDAIDSEEALRTSASEARRLRRRVREIVSDGSFESEPLDEFGIAKLGELTQVVPSLVLLSDRGTPKALDRRATATFLRFAERDASRALLRPARHAVDHMVRTLERADAGKETEIPVVREAASEYLDAAERDVRSIWPALGRRLADARGEL